MVTVLLVRHADIDLPPASNDPQLNTAGKARAKTLAQVVRAAGVTTIFTSTLVRTKLTVKPFATLAGLVPKESPPSAQLAQQIIVGTHGAVVLVAGHSNTVPEIIQKLGVLSPVPTIIEAEFDNLFVVAVAAPGQASLTRLKYGKPSA